MKVFIGYDSREDIAYHVCKHSILTKNSDVDVQALIQKNLRKAKIYNRPVDALASTEFTFTRFLVPQLMNFKGWALFCDCDIIFLNDVKELFDQADDKYAVMCAKHDYNPTEKVKMDGKRQTQYPRKNWSSVVLFNCAHPSNKKLTTDLVNEQSLNGAYFHRFSWLEDEEIGEFSHEWNWLVGWYKEPEDGQPKAIHYTEGGPWFEDYVNCEYADLWNQIKDSYLDSATYSKKNLE
jgi:lipopolysaccharide biosynthesis glycosyltransferase